MWDPAPALDALTPHLPGRTRPQVAKKYRQARQAAAGVSGHSSTVAAARTS